MVPRLSSGEPVSVSAVAAELSTQHVPRSPRLEQLVGESGFGDVPERRRPGRSSSSRRARVRASSGPSRRSVKRARGASG